MANTEKTHQNFEPHPRTTVTRERQATLTHTCDSYSCKEEGDGGQCPVRLVSVSSHVYDRGRGRMEEGGGRCKVRRIPHSAAHGVQLGANFLYDMVDCLVWCWRVGHE